ncbi:MAG: DUF423 domain-containing protein [Dehalococcoidia bacterium]
MKPDASFWICVGAILALLCVLFGAAGAHWLEALSDVDSKDTYETAVRFQMFHSIALLSIGLILNSQFTINRLMGYSPIFILIGTIVFCGSLYLISLSSLKWLGAVAPVGAVFLMLGWLMLGFSVLTETKRRKTSE